jgi:hypothetical protein
MSMHCVKNAVDDLSLWILVMIWARDSGVKMQFIVRSIHVIGGDGKPSSSAHERQFFRLEASRPHSPASQHPCVVSAQGIRPCSPTVLAGNGGQKARLKFFLSIAVLPFIVEAPPFPSSIRMPPLCHPT